MNQQVEINKGRDRWIELFDKDVEDVWIRKSCEPPMQLLACLKFAYDREIHKKIKLCNSEEKDNPQTESNVYPLEPSCIPRQRIHNRSPTEIVRNPISSAWTSNRKRKLISNENEESTRLPSSANNSANTSFHSCSRESENVNDQIENTSKANDPVCIENAPDTNEENDTRCSNRSSNRKTTGKRKLSKSNVVSKPLMPSLLSGWINSAKTSVYSSTRGIEAAIDPNEENWTRISSHSNTAAPTTDHNDDEENVQICFYQMIINDGYDPSRREHVHTKFLSKNDQIHISELDKWCVSCEKKIDDIIKHIKSIHMSPYSQYKLKFV